MQLDLTHVKRYASDLYEYKFRISVSPKLDDLCQVEEEWSVQINKDPPIVVDAALFSHLTGLIFSTRLVLLENDETMCLDGDSDSLIMSIGTFSISFSWHYLPPAWRSLEPILGEIERLKKQLFPDQWNKHKTYRDFVLELKEWTPEEREVIIRRTREESSDGAE